MKKKLALRIAASLLVFGLASSVMAADEIWLTGAGSTFSNPLYQKWFSDYHNAHPEIQVSYQSIGSGGGVKQIIAKTVDFGASDAPLSDKEMAETRGIVHIPTELGADVVTFNVKELSDLKLSPDTVAAIFLGEITRWNDKKIAADNPGIKLPDLALAVVHRSDGSGTTYVFADYLSHVSEKWKSKVGTGRSVNWPTGIGGNGNPGVMAQVMRLPGAVGYVEMGYAVEAKMPIAEIRNRQGEWIKPSAAAITAAADALADKIPDDLRVSIVDAPGYASYPISSFSYALLYQDQPDLTKGKALTNLLWWGIHDGQDSNEALAYARLPASVVKRAEAKLRGIQHGGKPVLGGP